MSRRLQISSVIHCLVLTEMDRRLRRQTHEQVSYILGYTVESVSDLFTGTTELMWFRWRCEPKRSKMFRQKFQGYNDASSARAVSTIKHLSVADVTTAEVANARKLAIFYVYYSSYRRLSSSVIKGRLRHLYLLRPLRVAVLPGDYYRLHPVVRLYVCCPSVCPITALN